ncbi:hypothetical protein DDJ91_07445 [Mycobacteroides abscessus]|nr:hypothetical protein DDJ91_07445 [Mycobacteroides abscessus]
MVTAPWIADRWSAHGSDLPCGQITTTQTKAGGGVGDGAGTRGGVTWSHDIDHQIAYITVACKRPAK